MAPTWIVHGMLKEPCVVSEPVIASEEQLVVVQLETDRSLIVVAPAGPAGATAAEAARSAAPRARRLRTDDVDHVSSPEVGAAVAMGAPARRCRRQHDVGKPKFKRWQGKSMEGIAPVLGRRQG
jgi:hypothetical protein